MKKVIILVLSLVLIWSVTAQALESNLIDTRNEILQAAQEMKAYFATSRDPILLNSMWDSSLMAVSQLDAYFSMLGIFNTIKKDNLDAAAFSYLVTWLNQLKETTALNIKSLGEIKSTTDARSKAFVLKLKGIFTNLEARIVKELQSVGQFQDSIKKP
ncbi:MAG: hypothetical protein PHS66_01290 [Candidatus Omnitrophica bacterium]|nr:hypothetical protein [Candidatus Omnitrophota bacterium]